jgi:hypothetical protein
MAARLQRIEPNKTRRGLVEGWMDRSNDLLRTRQPPLCDPVVDDPHQMLEKDPAFQHDSWIAKVDCIIGQRRVLRILDSQVDESQFVFAGVVAEDAVLGNCG